MTSHHVTPHYDVAPGETVFWERSDHDDDVINEIVAAVVPLMGRSVVFNGDFPHSATPPSGDGIRMTLAIKMVPGRWQAVMKNFVEDSRHETDLKSFVRFVLFVY